MQNLRNADGSLTFWNFLLVDKPNVMRDAPFARIF